MLIRQAMESDLPEVRELLKEMDGEDGISFCEAQAIWREMAKYPYYEVYVVEENRRIIATCTLIIIDNLGHMGAKLALAESMIVSQEYRGRAIGSKLMQFVMEKAKEENCYKLMLSSNKKRIEAHKFYEQLGFRQHGISFMIEVGKND
ncbi:GNAT family N-acetyltransferase [Desulfosporosinus shakirovi]|uniref:GNAT family N-acetyltransferase n=1 Tax=Desulfosporosinus shakirovi TaxID=2885154 RepID=UPI001E4A86F2|nr:GNAT family N-acetyltransferase [Desulfosporosinus sp. SRJS8]MCB8815468.1 GNAT family N-acetyltransferase [Desulfosporosinus sp. SRJS8]